MTTTDRTAAARAARTANATRRRHQRHAAELTAAGWTCTPPGNRASYFIAYVTINPDGHGSTTVTLNGPLDEDAIREIGAAISGLHPDRQVVITGIVRLDGLTTQDPS